MNAFWIILAAGTVFFLIGTWTVSVRDKRYHGYPRFFAFESVLILVLLNANVWFRNPWSLRQIFSWLFLLAAIIVVAAGFGALRKHGKPEGNFENTTRLVNVGIYKFIRHPMYASLVFLGVGVFLKRVRLITALVLTIDLVACWITALMDEREMKARFGDEYAAYMKTTKRFIPFIV
ncbi:MAG: isoprenylcysteine carboxylmethyltransferase family protein [Candidatus Aminicenantes bacterium]|nr:isoprenylcysteine carboxylmethyltransferase family protein [Candidatus Aminicenantes bacterium]